MTSVPISRITAELSRDGQHLKCQICGTALAAVRTISLGGIKYTVVQSLQGWKHHTSGIWEPNPRSKKRYRRDTHIVARHPDRNQVDEARYRLASGRSTRFNCGYDIKPATSEPVTFPRDRAYAGTVQTRVIWHNVEGESADTRVRCVGCGAVNWVTAVSVAVPELS